MEKYDLSDQASWKQRFRAKQIFSATVSQANSERGLICSNATGIPQLYAWDVVTGDLNQVTFSPTGVGRGAIAAKGEYIYYLNDHQGNEVGHYVRVPFAGGERETITPDLPLYAATGICEDPSGRVIGLITAKRNAFECYILAKEDGVRLSSPRLLWSASTRSDGLSFSERGEIAVIATLVSPEKNAYQLISINVASGERLGELCLPDANLRPIRFSPDPLESRVLCVSDQFSFVRPCIWDAVTHDLQELALPELAGDIHAWDWSRDGKLLLCQYYS